jgi:hypothetical protein
MAPQKGSWIMKRNLGLTMAATLGAVFAPVNAGVIYVDDSASSGGDGQSWSTALQLIRPAVTLAVAGDEVRVAGGFYFAFELKTGVAVRGGFRGLTGGGNPDERNLTAFPSRLAPSRPHTVLAEGVDRSAILDGFEFRWSETHDRPQFEEPFRTAGAGVLAIDAAPTILSCLFANNRAFDDGAAIYNNNSAALGLIDNCVFLDNIADDMGTVYGSWDIVNSTFRNNLAGFGGTICRQLGDGCDF